MVVPETPEPRSDGATIPIVAIGASAGGIDALTRVVGGIPPDLRAAVLVVVHTSRDGRSRLPQILSRAGALPAAIATDGRRIAPGTILVCPPDNHLTVDDGHVRVARGPRENLSRPAIDPLFRSAALSSASALVAVVLSGALDDGASGAASIEVAGGLVAVQDPDEALVPGMPRATLELVPTAIVLPAASIGPALPGLIAEAAGRRRRRPAGSESIEREIRMSRADPRVDVEAAPSGAPSALGCPECGGALWVQPGDEPPRFRCRTGHAFTARAVLASQDARLEDAMWSALRALEEHAALSHRLAERSFGGSRVTARLVERAQTARDRAGVLRRFLVRDEPAIDDPVDDPADATEGLAATPG